MLQLQIITFVVNLLLCLQCAHSKPLYTNSNSLNTLDNLVTPTEVFPIQPVLIYPKMRENTLRARSKSPKDNDIIFVKLLNRKTYRPKKRPAMINNLEPLHELNMKDIFYVKALANGQFSQQRLKLYRTPQFYAISVYKSQNKSENNRKKHQQQQNISY